MQIDIYVSANITFALHVIRVQSADSCELDRMQVGDSRGLRRSSLHFTVSLHEGHSERCVLLLFMKADVTLQLLGGSHSGQVQLT